MSSNKFVIAVIVILALVFIKNKVSEKTAQSQKNRPVASSKPVSKNAQQNLKQQAYGNRPTESSWPALTDSQSVADNLLSQNYYIIFDGSGSMTKQGCSGNDNKITVAKEAMGTFAKNIPEQANVGLFIFDGRGANERIALSTFHEGKFMHQINNVFAGGQTPLRTAINSGYKALTKQAQAQLGYGEYHLVIVTDGAASDGEDPVSVVSKVIKGSPVLIHTIGFCIGGNHSLNQAGLIEYKAANDPQSLVAGLEAVLAEAPDFNTNSFSGN